MAEGRSRRLLLCRHAETGPDWAGRFVGRTDPPLAGDGPRQAELLALAVGREKPGILAVSPRLRARQTAAVVAAATGLSPGVDYDLAEIDFGRWDGLLFAEIVARDPHLVAQWAASGEDFVFPEGEAVAAFRSRVAGALARLIATPVADRHRRGESHSPGNSIAVISHGGVVRTMLCQLLGLPPDRHLSFAVRPGRMAVVDLFDGGGATLAGFNLPWPTEGEEES